MRVSARTEVNLWIVVDRHIDLFLGLCGAPIIRRWMVVWDDLDGLFNELVALIFETLAIAVLACINATTEVVILRRRRRRSDGVSVMAQSGMDGRVTYLSPSAGTTSLMRSFWLISSMRRCRV